MLNLIPLKENEIKSINGGDKFSEDIFMLAGWLWGEAKKFGNNVFESYKARQISGQGRYY